jgi:hypothetical protein
MEGASPPGGWEVLLGWGSRRAGWALVGGQLKERRAWAELRCRLKVRINFTLYGIPTGFFLLKYRTVNTIGKQPQLFPFL